MEGMEGEGGEGGGIGALEKLSNKLSAFLSDCRSVQVSLYTCTCMCTCMCTLHQHCFNEALVLVFHSLHNLTKIKMPH